MQVLASRCVRAPVISLLRHRPRPGGWSHFMHQSDVSPVPDISGDVLSCLCIHPIEEHCNCAFPIGDAAC